MGSKLMKQYIMYMIYVTLGFSFLSVGYSAPTKTAPTKANFIEISDINAPHPQHCLDERQWKDLKQFSPFNLFDSKEASVWQPCSYALRDAGYTVNVELAHSIEIDGFQLSRVNENETNLLKGFGKKKKKKKKKS